MEKLKAKEERHTITVQPERSYATGKCEILHKEKKAWEHKENEGYREELVLAWDIKSRNQISII